MPDDDVFSNDAGGRRERPVLYPWNRKLRHLQGVSVRNLNLDFSNGRPRGKTTTDDAVPYNLRSPAKLLANEDTKLLQHSRSYSDLKSTGNDLNTTPKKLSTPSVNDVDSHSRPNMRKLRRRSTLQWTGSTPRVRQQKLEAVVANRIADTWFSIHGKGIAEPIYVSEVMDKCMNPTFGFFDLNTAGPAVTRSDELAIKIWAKSSETEEFTLLIHIDLTLTSLQFLGKSLENFHHPLPQNCVLFHLVDGIYTSFTDMPVGRGGLSSNLQRMSKAVPVEYTSSYDALMRLTNLDECMQDALSIRQKLESQINALLQHNRDASERETHRSEERERSAGTQRAIEAESKHNKTLVRKRDGLRATIRLRAKAIASGTRCEPAQRTEASRLMTDVEEIRATKLKSQDVADGQIRRICEDLLSIYPIEPVKNKTLQFTIRGIHLPNSSFDDTNRDEIAAALGFTSHLVYLLSNYLSIALPYPIESNASFSFINDPISIALAQRRFPLHPINVAYKFEYGVFLLNKDIEFLMSKAGLRMLDIRHTLPNLKYLLYVLTAGTGELPARKAGGVRGLTGGRATPSMSRRGSNETVFSDSQDHPKGTSDPPPRNGSLAVPVRAREKVQSLEDPFLASPRTKTFSYRHSLLRDAG